MTISDVHVLGRAEDSPHSTTTVAVLGMHRSGTSALTRVLNLLGVHLGNPADFIPPAPDNPRGFWENRPLVLVNDALLRLFGGSWDAPPTLPDGWDDGDAVGDLREPAASRLAALDPAEAAAHVGWKDPRVCLTLPFWRAVAGPVQTVHMLRDPDAVIGSLHHRNGLDEEHAARLWVRYVGDAFRDAPDSLVCYQQDLFDDLDALVTRLVAFFDLPHADGTAREQISEFVDPGLRRHRDYRAPAGPWTELARQLFAAARGGATPHEIVALRDETVATLEPVRRGTHVLVITGDRSGPDVSDPRKLSDTLADRDVSLAVVWPGATATHRYGTRANGMELAPTSPAGAIRLERPDVLVFADVAGLRETFGAALAHTPEATYIGTGGLDGPLFDASVPTLADLPDVDLTGGTGPGPARVGEIPARHSRTGVTSIVVPVYNKWALTERCLETIAEHTEAPVEIVVVDNGSTDATPAELARRPGVVVVRNERNLGFPAACNQGIAAASGEFVCILNNDVEVTPGWLDALHEALAVPGTGLVGPRSNSISGRQVIPGAPAFDGTNDLQAWARSWCEARPPVSWRTGVLIGFCLLGRRALFERLGGFDEGVGLGNYEDDELCARVRNDGLRLRVAERSVILHHGSATFDGNGLDRAATMRAGARHTAGRLRRDDDLVHGVVLSDGQPQAAVATAASLLGVCESVTIWERGDLESAKRLASPLPPGAVVEAMDWHDGDAVSAASASAASEVLLVLGAGEELASVDAVTSRVELEALLGAPASLRVGSSHEEIRVTPAVEQANELVGLATDEPPLQTLRVVPA